MSEVRTRKTIQRSFKIVGWGYLKLTKILGIIGSIARLYFTHGAIQQKNHFLFIVHMATRFNANNLFTAVETEQH